MAKNNILSLVPIASNHGGPVINSANMKTSCTALWQAAGLILGLALIFGLAGCDSLPQSDITTLPGKPIEPANTISSTKPAVEFTPTSEIKPTPHTATSEATPTLTLTPQPQVPISAQNLSGITEGENHSINLGEVILAAAWSQDGSKLAVARGDQVQLLDGQGLQPGMVLPVGVYTQAVVFDPQNPGRLITGSNDGLIRIWNLADASVEMSLAAQPKGVNQIVAGLAGKVLASAGNDAMIYLWDLPDGRETGSLIGGAFVVPDLAADPGGETLISVDGGVIRVREISTGRLVISIYTDGSVPEIAVSPDGRTIAAARSGGLIQLYDLETGDLIWERGPQPGSEPWTVAFHPDGDVLASGWRNGAVCWQGVLVPDEVNCMQAHTRPVGVVRFRPDGLLMLSGGYDGWLRFWQAGP